MMVPFQHTDPAFLERVNETLLRRWFQFFFSFFLPLPSLSGACVEFIEAFSSAAVISSLSLCCCLGRNDALIALRGGADGDFFLYVNTLDWSLLESEGFHV